MDEVARKRRALDLWNEGYQRHLCAFALAREEHDQQAVKELARAVELYSESIEAFPTAEAHTFRGWAYKSVGRVDDAIAECKRAIEVDPDYGNPYNDIGAYLIDKGEADEAIQWLEKAKRAPRYEPRHYPCMNLGRLYTQKGMVMKAIAEFEEALKLAAGDQAAEAIQQQLQNLRAMLN